jgi:hypothetical protein
MQDTHLAQSAKSFYTTKPNLNIVNLGKARDVPDDQSTDRGPRIALIVPSLPACELGMTSDIAPASPTGPLLRRLVRLVEQERAAGSRRIECVPVVPLGRI